MIMIHVDASRYVDELMLSAYQSTEHISTGWPYMQVNWDCLPEPWTWINYQLISCDCGSSHTTILTCCRQLQIQSLHPIQDHKQGW
jgi:hypothetical protein